MFSSNFTCVSRHSFSRSATASDDVKVSRQSVMPLVARSSCGRARRAQLQTQVDHSGVLGAVWTRAMNLGAFFWEHNILVELLQVLPAKDLLCCWHLARTMLQLRAARAP